MAVDSATEKIGEHYFVTDSSTNGHAWNIKLATWANMNTDLGNYYAYYGYIQDNGAYLRVAKQLSTSDSWRLQVNTGYFYKGSEIVGTAAGYFPVLNNWVYHVTGPGDYTLRRYNDNRLDVGSSQFNAATFKEGTVPYVLGVLVHGAGGGGGGTYGTGDGTGGGAGGCITGVFKLGGSASIHIGAGGAGGYKKEVTTTEGQGKSGGTSYIYLGGYAFEANGGGPGRNSTKSNAYAGGTGGTCKSTGAFQFCASSKQGGNGGKVYSLQNATGMAAQTVKFTALTTVISGATHTTVSATKGGDQGDNKAPGGGGGSREKNGPKGGGFQSDGVAGEKGSGGSGGRWDLVAYHRGGKGGDGYVTLFY